MWHYSACVGVQYNVFRVVGPLHSYTQEGGSTTTASPSLFGFPVCAYGGRGVVRNFLCFRFQYVFGQYVVGLCMRFFVLLLIVEFRHYVIDRHALFNSGSRFLAWGNLVQTGAAYSAVE